MLSIRTRWWVAPAIFASLLVAAAICSGAAAEKSRGAAPSFGYNESWFGHPNRIQSAVAGGADTLRLGINWASTESQRGALWWGSYDEVYHQALAAGARPLLVVMGAPCWASRKCGAKAYVHPPKARHLDRWSRFVGKVARRYPQARALEIWNEQNYTKFWSGKLDPKRYGRLLAAAERGARRTNPAMPVISGGLLPSPDDDPKQMAYPKFLKRSLRAAGRRHFDGVGVHPFPFFAEDYVGKVRKVMRKTRRITRQVGGRSKELWVTEVGVSTAPPDNYSLAKQARALGRIYDALARMRDVSAIIIHRFVDVPGSDGRDAGWGVTNPNGSVKPAYCALAKRRGRSC